MVHDGRVLSAAS